MKSLAAPLAHADAALPVRSGVAASNILRGYLGLLVQGESAFDAIEDLRDRLQNRRTVTGLSEGRASSCRSALRQ